ncbi:MAG: hypothetical protein IJ521_02230, partial [Schwartzia sp.]|nr:hypothetical protein [Schwartzia sp. (in: firmicutes)]
VSILRFSLPKGKAAGVEDEFLSLLCSTLRAGDVVTETGGQFLVLLVNTSYPNLSHAVDRFRQNWVGTNAGADVEFEYEWSVMEP